MQLNVVYYFQALPFVSTILALAAPAQLIANVQFMAKQWTAKTELACKWYFARYIIPSIIIKPISRFISIILKNRIYFWFTTCLYFVVVNSGLDENSGLIIAVCFIAAIVAVIIALILYARLRKKKSDKKGTTNTSTNNAANNMNNNNASMKGSARNQSGTNKDVPMTDMAKEPITIDGSHSREDSSDSSEISSSKGGSAPQKSGSSEESSSESEESAEDSSSESSESSSASSSEGAQQSSHESSAQSSS